MLQEAGLSLPKLLSAFRDLFAMFAATSLQPHPARAADQVELERERYLKEIDGQMVDLYTLENKSGMVVKITHWGAKAQQILGPDKEGVLGDVALGYEPIDHLDGGQAS